MSDPTNAAPAAPATATPATNTPATENQAAQPAVTEEVATPDQVAALEKEVAAQEAARKFGKKKYNLKVDGKEEAFELDLDNEQELIKHLQMSKVSQKRMQEKAEYEKNVRNFFEALKADPLRVLSDPNLLGNEKLKQMANLLVNQEVEELTKSPEQKQREALQKELETMKKQAELEKKQRDEADMKRMTDQARVTFDKDISDAIETSGLPKTAYTVQKLAEVMMLAWKNGKKISAADAVPVMKKQTLGDFRDVLGALGDDALEEWMGQDNIKRIRKRTLARLKSQVASPNEVKPTGNTKTDKKQDKMSAKAFFKMLGK